MSTGATDAQAEGELRPSADLVAEGAAMKAAAQKAAAARRAEGDGKQAPKVSKEEQERLNALKKLDITGHKKSPQQLEKEFADLYGGQANIIQDGLTTAQAAKGAAKFGPNALTPPKQTPEWIKCLETQKGFFNLLLWAGSILCFISYGIDNSAPDNLYLGIVLALVVIATGVFEYFQEKSSSDLMKKFASMQPPAVTVIRNGKETTIPAIELTHGDMVKVSYGDKIPADLRVVNASADCKVDQASLTGEPDHLKRTPKCTHDDHYETENLMFFGTLCSSGKADCMVIGIGDGTVMGSISALTTGTKAEQTPINKEIEHFVFIVASVAIFLGVSFFIIGVVKDVTSTGTVNITTQLVFMIGIIVANVPEGLLATVTVCLTLTAKRMAQKNVLVKNLESVETLGSTSCICSDKTGTLTQNKMTTTNICCDGMLYEFKYAAAEGEHKFPKCDLYTSGPKAAVVESIKEVTQGNEYKGTIYNVKFDDPKLGKSGDNWVTIGMIEKDGVQGEEHWMTQFEGSDAESKSGNKIEVKVGDKINVIFSPDSLRRINRVCALQNTTSFDDASKVVQDKKMYEESDRRKICEIFSIKSKEWDTIRGKPLPFRFRQEMKNGGARFPMDQWLPNADASSNALVRWCNDKPLWDDAAYDACGYKFKEWDGPLHIKDSYSAEAVQYECDMPGMDLYKKAYPAIALVSDGVEKSWRIPFNSKNKFAVSVHKQPGAGNKALLLMKGGSDVILERCDHVMHRGKRIPLTPALRARYEELNLVLAKMGRRVLSSAEYELPEDTMPASWTGFECETALANFPLGTSKAKCEEEAAKMREINKESGDEAFPESKIKAMLENQPKKLTFLGMTALIDPHRPSVPDAVDKCHEAGILVVMVTGDHPATAEAIAKTIGIIKTSGGATCDDRKDINKRMYGVPALQFYMEGATLTAAEKDKNNKWWAEFKKSEIFQKAIAKNKSNAGLMDLVEHPWNDKRTREGVPHGADQCIGQDPDFAPAIVVPGKTFTNMTETENPAWWPHVLSHREIVFARTSPKQKLMIVDQFQKKGNVVAVTGDGVNDAPALKKANIGVAMGIAGTDVSKEAADMILLDDNFASIVNGVEEGRLIFDNLKKSIAYTLSSNIPEISPFLSFITVGIPLPLSTVLILCIDLGTDMVPAISMAWEGKEADIMKRPPRDQKKDRLVTKKLVCFAYLQIGVIQAVAGFFSYMVVMGDYGYYSHTLPGLGADDAWQKVQLMCKVKGGVLRNEDGWAYPGLNDFSGANYKKINDAFAKGYMFWDWNTVERDDPAKQMAGMKVGDVITCAHAPRSINSEAAQPDGFKWSDPITYANNELMTSNNYTYDAGADAPPTSYTAGRPVTSVNTIIAMKKAGWIEYLPFAARMSAFYDKNWAYWEPVCGSSGETCDVNVAGGEGQYCCGSVSGIAGVATIQGYGEAGADAHFAGTPAGYRVLPKWSKQVAGTAVYPGLVTDSIITPSGSEKFWPGETPMAKTNAADQTTSWQSDLFDMPRYDDYEELKTDYKKSADVNVTVGTKTCTSWTLSDTNVVSNKRSDCLNTEDSLADNMYSWFHGTKVRVNVMNRMLQREALAFAQTSGFTTIIVVQWADLMICKTRWLSIRQQGMSNPLMNFGLLFETILGAFVCFVPFLNAALQTRPLRFTHWMPGMPFMVLIFMYDETRKYLMRTGSTDEVDPQTGQVTKNFNWVGENTYY
jgi:magnesium-transporting ATPase (P-type)